MTDGPGQNGTDRAERLRAGLESLRETGSALLVVGSVPEPVSKVACEAMRGREPDERVVLETGGGYAATPSPATAGQSHVLRWATDARGGTATMSTTSAATSPSTDTTVDSLPELAEATEELLAEAASDGPTGDLRVCVGSLLPLVESTSERSTFELLHAVTALTRRAEGLGHAHLPLARESALVQLFEPLFDVTVELRVADGQPQQRWHLHEADVSSDWLPLEAVVDR